MKPSHEQGCIMRRFNIILIKKVLHRSSIQQTWAIVLPPTSKQPYMGKSIICNFRFEGVHDAYFSPHWGKKTKD